MFFAVNYLTHTYGLTYTQKKGIIVIIYRCVYKSQEVIMDNLFKQDDLSDLLSQIDTSKIAQSEDFVSGEAMKESQRRYEEIIKKHEEDNE